MHTVKMQQLSELAKRRRENTPKGFKSISDDYLSQPFNYNLEKHGLEPSLPTSRNLEKRLNEYFSISLDETYGTNLFPC